MCSHYDPVLNPAKLQEFFGVSDIQPDLKPSSWPGYISPFIRKHEHADVGDDAVPYRELMEGSFGMIPHWASDEKIARTTYNARSETAHEKNSFRDAWRLARHCIIPAEAIWEPDWRSGKAVQTRIVRKDGRPMGIAGLWTACDKVRPGITMRSFTMLTINADDHPFMKNYHQPDHEKRMVVILDESQYDAYLGASPEDTRHFLKQFPSENMTPWENPALQNGK